MKVIFCFIHYYICVSTQAIASIIFHKAKVRRQQQTIRSSVGTNEKLVRYSPSNMKYPVLFSITQSSSENINKIPILQHPLNLLDVTVDGHYFDTKGVEHTNIDGNGVPLLNNITTIQSTFIGDQGLDSITKQRQLRNVMDVIGIVGFSFIISLLLISWEDMSCQLTLPSRHRTPLILYQHQDQPLSWGISTINGMGFGEKERQLLSNIESYDDVKSNIFDEKVFEIDPLLSLPSYNEIMLKHRVITVPNWRLEPTKSIISGAIHTVIESLQQVEKLRLLAQDYQWDTIRYMIHDVPISNLIVQASILRQTSPEMNNVVGFDWGSCAWRHCGAIADIQESIDEMDQLLGVLEPYEIIFCLDIVERSLRDILSVIPWQQYASDDDIVFYNQLPPYETTSKYADNDADDDSEWSRIDDAYVKALQELRID